MNNKPNLSVRDKALSASFFKKQGEKGEYYSVCIQRSYKDRNGEWKRESINIFPEDLLKLSALTFRAYNVFVEEPSVKEDVPAAITSEQYAAQSDGDLNDFVPF